MHRLQFIIVSAVLSCSASPRSDSARDSLAETAAPAPDTSAVRSATAPRALPPTGLAFPDTTDKWCGAFTVDSLRAGQVLTIVFPDSNAPQLTAPARIIKRRTDPCQAVFPQNAVADLPSYDLAVELMKSVGWPGVGVAVAGTSQWRRDVDRIARADLNGDGALEEVTVCAVGEGQQFTLWTRAPSDTTRRKVWDSYYDWGALVDVTCPTEG